MTTAHTAAMIRRMGESVIAMADALAHAEQVQLLPPAAPTKALTDRRASSSRIARPTEETALDPRRLRVRAAALAGEDTANRIAEMASTATAELADAVRAWGGLRA